MASQDDIIRQQGEQLDRIEAMLADIRARLDAYEVLFGTLGKGPAVKVAAMVLKAMGDNSGGGLCAHRRSC
jgi:hypothetical protein